jgi:hypothetical protein
VRCKVVNRTVRCVVGFLSRDAIFDADDRSFDVVPVPEWGGEVRIRSITGRQRDQYESSLMDDRGNDRKLNLRNARAKLIVLCAVDENGQALFTADDVNRLGSKNAKPVDRLFDACKKIAGLTDEDVDGLVQDFGATPDED